ncbi:hypothetical protein [Bradyrhizobium sp. ARR65]|nr:hypothetical protein [Bradyrhizobium sp. ARR65]
MTWMSEAVLGCAVAGWLTVPAAPAQGEKRIALVIGNNDDKNVSKLRKAM